jgi:hypothetical protein
MSLTKETEIIIDSIIFGELEELPDNRDYIYHRALEMVLCFSLQYSEWTEEDVKRLIKCSS